MSQVNATDRDPLGDDALGLCLLGPWAFMVAVLLLLANQCYAEYALVVAG